MANIFETKVEKESAVSVSVRAKQDPTDCDYSCAPLPGSKNHPELKVENLDPRKRGVWSVY